MVLDKKWRDTPRFVQRIFVCPYNFGRKTGEKESSVENHPIFAPENSKQSNDYDYDHKEEFRNAGAHEHRCGSHNDIHILL
jgi:hypothetical protein